MASREVLFGNLVVCSDGIFVLVPIVIFVAAAILAVAVIVLLPKRRTKTEQDVEKYSDDDSDHEETLQFEFNAVRAATDNFSDVNKLGQGGFGYVYKGKLHDGRDIAVKRLSQNSGQGEQEFKNEVILMSKLDHKNLAWRNWKAGTALKIIDPILGDGSRSEMMRSPSKPAFLYMDAVDETDVVSPSSDQSHRKTREVSVNEVSFSEFDPR
ncbi:hypothetical protein COLO4_31703 [Corchorus olitorius]|uniref:Protein kinase domain-containing protein n=1 Tax=Corchorus olitorius TaxID=93759 RepID=A0A1R3H3K0_9ROSI|nr:hypothetical protein COLO4_31703 [Corchorus olitorius]